MNMEMALLVAFPGPRLRLCQVLGFTEGWKEAGQSKWWLTEMGKGQIICAILQHPESE